MEIKINILFPSGYRVKVSRLRQQLDEAHLAWQKERAAHQAEFKLENVRFRHDPKWRHRFFSIQSAHSGNHPIWKATRVIWMSMGGSI